MNNVMLELKFKPKDDPDSSDEEKRQADQCKSIGEDKELTSEAYLKKLFVEKNEQTKKVIQRQKEEIQAKLKAVFIDDH